MKNVKKTPLYEAHSALGGQIIDFSGWALPVKYSDIKSEHKAVRTDAGLFDVSHMGEVTLKGPEAETFVNYLVTNNIATLKEHQIAYTMMCYEDGGVVDDLLVYKYSTEHYYLVINASNIDKDYEWIQSKASDFDVVAENISDTIAEIAIQGPKAEEILQKITATDLSEIKFFYFKDEVLVNDKKCLVSRTGYTGEDGFEIYTANKNITSIWNKLLDVGTTLGLKPAGLGARDTLRFEVALPLYGHEISKEISPLEAGLGYFVKLEKENFIGKDALVQQKKEGLKRKLVGFKIERGGIPRHGYTVVKDDKEIGFVTTGYLSPSLNEKIGLAIIDERFSAIDTEIGIKHRRRVYNAKVINKKFYSKNYKK